MKAGSVVERMEDGGGLQKGFLGSRRVRWIVGRRVKEMRMPRRMLTANTKKIVRVREGLDVAGRKAELNFLPNIVDVKGVEIFSRMEVLLPLYA